MDYWHDLDVTVYDSWRDFVRKNKEKIGFPAQILTDAGLDAGTLESVHADAADSGGKMRSGFSLWMATTKALKVHSDACFKDGDFIMFGKESAGIPEKILLQSPDTCIRIPMLKGSRSLNLSNSAAVVLYEALRQNDYPELTLKGQLHHNSWNQ